MTHTMLVKAGGDPASGWTFIHNANSPLSIDMTRASLVIRAPALTRRYVKIPIATHFSEPMQWPEALRILSEYVRNTAAEGL